MSSITLHNLNQELYERLVEEATDKGLSLNKIAQKILGDAMGVTKTKKKRDLSRFVGMWTKEEADKFDRIIEEEFEKIDKEDWK